MEILGLHGHTRNITKVLYNRDGDLLFSAGKDKRVVLWRVSDGEPIGTYEVEMGAINDCDVTADSKYLATGDGNNYMCVWEVETGTKLATAEFRTSVNSVSWSCGGKYLLGLSLEQRSYPNAICIYEWNPEAKKLTLVKDIISAVAKENLPVFSAVYGPMDKYIAIASENGAVTIYDCAKMTTISPLKDEVILGGGQEAREVTTTSVDKSQFKTVFYDLILETEIGKIEGHFSPINSLAFSPDGTSFVTGGEDGYVRLCHFDQKYLESNRSERSGLLKH